MIYTAYTVIYLLLFFIGAAVGSFVNVVAYRQPRGEDFVRGRSHCDSCGAALTALDLVPVISYIALKGRCRRCKAALSPRYMITEILSGVCACFSYFAYGAGAAAIAAFAMCALLMLISLVDIDSMTIPNGYILLMLIPAAAMLAAMPGVSLKEHIIGFFAVSVPLYVIALIVPDSFGGGDIKLMAAVGFALGWKCALLALFLGIISAGGYAVYLLSSGKRKSGAHIPFGPHLAAGSAVAMFAGDALLRWYAGFF